MQTLHRLIEANPFVAAIVLITGFAVLAKCADFFVDSSIAVANRAKIPRLVIGIVLVSFATTAPELSVSLISAMKGNPEMALGNAIGSVICDDGLALGFAGLFAATPILIVPTVLKTSGLFLLFIEALAFIFVMRDFTLNRWEGGVLVFFFVLYLVFLFRQHSQGLFKETAEQEYHVASVAIPLSKAVPLFLVGLGGIIFSSDLIITSATTIATALSIPQSIIALTLVAFGTSIPEVATCIAAARKGEGALAVGNILGADIMNICWVAGASSLANDLKLGNREIFFMFPAMFIIVGAMLILLRMGYRLTRLKGIILLSLYALYLIMSVALFPVGS